ncbi:MAG: diaminopimelate decarboxylase [Bacteroidales bacterium]|jgi:diaminopimelate decarboxylase|nr:diaminopimelate decarboxylase [Bacteroidales bacterium]MDD4293334.1 diaminopimelate decarboxylase [Bacteroidales bacterium]HNW48835.1 diaminopimelate decarboxylase [Bacteroidales bacterium]HPS95498.1 diaminopimelate decarboxylase [Bacteroidales bacterium]
MVQNKETERFKTLETPFYYYDMELLRETLKRYTDELKKYNYHAHYALKANANVRVLSLIKDFGLGADCVSGNEVSLALKTGFSPDKVVYAGVGKSDKEIKTALEGGIFCFNCESVPEIEVINSIAESMGKKVGIALRINPDIDAHTHKYISTGRSQDKFGISPWMFDEVLATIKKSSNINLIGLHFHVGSQITDLNVFSMLCKRVNEIQKWFIERGIFIENINLGGGLGIDYVNPDENPISDFKNYFSIINSNLIVYPGQKIHFEPGRTIVAQCGSLISRVLYVKMGKGKKFAILDAGMNDLIRPALYQASHRIDNLTSKGRVMRYDVVGPVCESSDRFGKNLLLPQTKRGDLVAIRSAGAYGQVMAMRYNQKDIAPEYFSENI